MAQVSRLYAVPSFGTHRAVPEAPPVILVESHYEHETLIRKSVPPQSRNTGTHGSQVGSDLVCDRGYSRAVRPQLPNDERGGGPQAPP